MSKEAALAFLKKVAQDADLQSKLVAFAAGEGYEFSVDELSEAELEAAAGGGVFFKYDGIEGESDADKSSSTSLPTRSASVSNER